MTVKQLARYLAAMEKKRSPRNFQFEKAEESISTQMFSDAPRKLAVLNSRCDLIRFSRRHNQRDALHKFGNLICSCKKEATLTMMGSETKATSVAKATES